MRCPRRRWGRPLGRGCGRCGGPGGGDTNASHQAIGGAQVTVGNASEVPAAGRRVFRHRDVGPAERADDADSRASEPGSGHDCHLDRGRNQVISTVLNWASSSPGLPAPVPATPEQQPKCRESSPGGRQASRREAWDARHCLRWATRQSRRGRSPSSKATTSGAEKPPASRSTSGRSKKCTMKPPCSVMLSPRSIPVP